VSNAFLNSRLRDKSDTRALPAAGGGGLTPTLEATSQCWSDGKKGGDGFQKFGKSFSE